VGARGRRRAGGQDAPAGAALPLLLFEAAGCLMAVPASEVGRLATLESEPGADEDEAGDRVDLGQRFGGGGEPGPWLRWSRGQRRAWLRVSRVVEVIPCAIAALAPMPSALRGGPFWAVGVRGDDVFLLLDPAKLDLDTVGRDLGPAGTP
jgi:hypothetical protein